MINLLGNKIVASKEKERYNILNLNTTAVYIDDISGISTSNSCMHLTDNGLNLYLGNTTEDGINHFTLSTPYDTTTRTFVSLLSGLGNVFGFDFNTAGTKLYTATGGVIKEFDLGTVWQTGGAVLRTSFTLTEATTTTHLKINSDSTTLYITDYGNDRILQYDFGTAGDITTIILNTSFSYAGLFDYAYGLYFNPDFTLMQQVNDELEDYVYQFDLTTAELVSTAANMTSIKVLNGSARGLTWSDSGNAFYHLMSNTITKYII